MTDGQSRFRQGIGFGLGLTVGVTVMLGIYVNLGFFDGAQASERHPTHAFIALPFLGLITRGFAALSDSLLRRTLVRGRVLTQAWHFFCLGLAHSLLLLPLPLVSLLVIGHWVNTPPDETLVWIGVPAAVAAAATLRRRLGVSA